MKAGKFAVIAVLSLFASNLAWADHYRSRAEHSPSRTEHYPSQADDYRVGPIEIDDLWVRASAPGQVNGAGYMEIENEGALEDRLLSVTSNAAESVTIHAVRMENGVAKMRPLEGGLLLPAMSEVKLAPGGYHIMFEKLKAPFARDARVPAILKFERAGEVAVMFKVRHAAYVDHIGQKQGAMQH
jgi:copper(I)-binding protein